MSIRTTRILQSAVAAATLLSASAWASGAHAIGETPNVVQSLTVEAVSGVARTVNLKWDPPSNVGTVALSGYQVFYRCLTKATKAGPCTGKWRATPLPNGNESGFYEVDDTTDDNSVDINVVLPSGTGGRSVTFAITPLSDDDTPLSGDVVKGSDTVIDLPTVSDTPLTLSSTAKKRVTVKISNSAIASSNGSSGYTYSVSYSSNGRDWFPVSAPSGGWSLGAQTTFNATRSGVRYYFRMSIATTAGTTITPTQSVISR